MMLELNKLYNTDCMDGMARIPDESINCCVTSPPYYGLRDYGTPGQIGLEETPEQYIQRLVELFREVHRVLKKDGTLWVIIGDSYAGSRKGQTKTGCADPKNTKTIGMSLPTPKNALPAKNLIGIPWMLAFALRADGWWLRQDIIWAKPNPMPESVTDRCTKSHEYIFLLSKSPKYYFNHFAIKEPAVTKPVARNKKAEGYQADYAAGDRFSDGMRVYGADGMRNKRDVWNVSTKPYKEAHFAVFPEDLITPCVLAGCPEDGVVIDPFFGSGTSGVVAKKLGRNFIGIELNTTYCDIADRRIQNIVSA